MHNKNIHLKRNYWLLLTIFHFLLFLFWRERVSLQISYLNDSYNYDNLYEFVCSDHYKKLNDLIVIFYSYFAFSLIIVYFLSFSLTMNLKLAKRYLFVWFLVYFAPTFGYIIYMFENGAIQSHFTDIEYTIIFYFAFFPIVFLIIKYTIIGIFVDDKPALSKQNKNEFNSIEFTLNELKNNHIFTEEEYELKRKENLFKKIKTEFYLSDNYQKLMDLKSSGILTEEEFNIKVFDTINSMVEKELKKY